MLTWKDITAWFAADRETAIGYKVVGSVALCLADPVGPLDKREAALREFDAYCFRRGWIPCLFAAGQQTADLASGMNWTAVEVAEDSVMQLAQLEFKGKAFQDVRTAINKAGKQNVELVVTSWADSKPVVTDQLRAISGGWVSDKALPEMGFTLGTLREAEDPEVRLHLAVDADQTVEGFTSWMPVYEDGQVVGWTLDLMRRRDQGFRPVMEFMIGASAMQLKEEGYRFVSLSAAPLAKAPDQLGTTQRPGGAAEAPRLPRQDVGAVLRLPVAVRLQAEVPARAPSDVPRVPGHDGTRPRSASPSPVPTCPTPGCGTGRR